MTLGHKQRRKTHSGFRSHLTAALSGQLQMPCWWSQLLRAGQEWTGCIVINT